MIGFKVEIDKKLFREAFRKLSKSEIRQALRMALNDSVIKGKTMVRRSIQDVYNIKAARINDSNSKKGLTLKKATNNDLSASIKAGHKPLGLAEMNPQYSGAAIAQQVSFKAGKARKGKIIKRSSSYISIEVIKGQRKVIGSAFAIGVGTNAANGQQFATPAIFARGKRGKPGFEFGKARFPIDSISTVSIATAATNAKTLDGYQEELNSYANKRFVHHIERKIKEAMSTAGSGTA